ncbi:MAG: O-antigen ligase domain-containing protein [Symploca sp. SIO3E6]|nr:O-antigen ligase domain-containing protein [Caldora sp. SIO3E6]
MLIWCICPVFSSVSNGLGLYDGVSTTIAQSVTWWLPYFLGRIYLNSISAMRQLAIGVFIGGLAYVPLCLFEIRMSPQLHSIFYGAHAFGDFGQSIRYDGFRPTVFLRHGLAVGGWMMVATLVGIWLWQTGAIKKLWNIHIKWLVAALFVTFVLCKSTGAYVLLLLSVTIMFLGKLFRTALPLFLLIATMGAYLYINAATETYFTDQLVASLSGIFDADRIQSLEFRFNNEELLTDHARERPVFGWAGWGRSRAVDPQTGKDAIQDSLWIIAFGQYGALGLIAWIVSMSLPVLSLFSLRYPASLWYRRDIGTAAVLAVALTMYTFDCLLNAMINPIYILAGGGISGIVVQNRVPQKSRRRPQSSKQMPQSSKQIPQNARRTYASSGRYLPAHRRSS